MKERKRTLGEELDRLKAERARILEAFKNHELTAKQTLERKEVVEDEIMKVWQKIRRKKK